MSRPPFDLAQFVSPAELAAAMNCSERTLRQKARALRACRVVGKTMVLTQDDVRVLGRRVTDGDYEELRALRTRQEQKGSSPRKTRESGRVISMAPRRS